VFVVGCLGNWRPTAEVLFESESLRRDTTKKQKNECKNESYCGENINKSIRIGVHLKDLGNIVKTLTASYGTGGSDYQVKPLVLQNNIIRKLTEIECERLQGFPDNYTNIKENCPSGARYKALGNSMAVPVMRWIGERINSYETMRSSAVVQVETGVGLAEV
jgi:DNA (cytosine-5)-methyltransferase 1